MPLPRKRSDLAVIASQAAKAVRVKLPPPPDTVPEATRPEWRKIVAQLHAAEMLRPSMLPAIEALCVGLAMMRAAQLEIDKAGRYFIDDKGNTKAHPAGGDLMRGSKMVDAAGKALGINASGVTTSKKTTAPTKATAAPSPWAIGATK